MDLSLNKITRLIILFTFIIALLYFGRPILVPLAFSFFLSMMLYPAASFLERIGIPRIVSIIMVFLGVLIIIAGTMFFFGTQFYHLFQNIKDFGKNLGNLLDNGITWVNAHILTGDYQVKDLYGKGAGSLLGSTKIIEKTLTSSTSFFASLALSIVFTFLFLLYRGSFKEFVILHFRDRKKEEAALMVNTIQKVAQNYFFGLILVILTLGTLNGTGLWIIGLDYPYLFGYFAALLAIIPYIGTFIGGLLPTLYALINYDSLWMPVLVIILYVSVQALEGNVLTPKIVGSKVSLNPLFALIALFT
ncbi:MAG TPA: AI-2E family transporter, partial [Bacteroidales bacterium]|nr:AI-2E family transporter [Bacteroidales bacterium]